ncbi:MAG TPA: ATP-binding protein [Candidatus Limnocylindrales bacterium]|nr:ATP-binding protein [Candidatus Limnocylindrales bacterium]
MAQPAPVPPSEERRLAALYEYELLDTPFEDLFDAFTRLAAQLCDAPISLITLVDRDRQWFKSSLGLDVRETAREIAFCAHTILGEGIFEVNDAAHDARFADNPLVTGDPGIRFYAGYPLRSGEGEAVGTICVIDRRPRVLTPEQRTSLALIANAVVEQMEARRTLLRLFDSSQTELYHADLAAQRILFASDAARRNLGYTMDELRQLPLDALLPSLARQGRLAERLGELRANPGRRINVRTTARRKDGTVYPIELRIEMVPTRQREIALVVATDLTESERAQERINLLSAAIEAAQDPIILSKPGPTPEDSPTIVYANDAFIRMKGAERPDQVIGHRSDEFLGPKTDRSRLAYMRAEAAAGRAARIEYISYRLDGSHYHTEASMRPLLDENGVMTHYVMVQRDVTEQVLRGMQLTMQNERLTAITSIARTLFSSLEPSVLVDALLSGVHELVDGRATLYAPRPRGGFAATNDLALHEDARLGDDLIAVASRSDVCVLDEREHRAAVRVPGSGGGTAYVLDVQRAAPFGTADVFALGLLGQYFAVAARNVELYQELASRRDAVVELNQVKNDLIAMLAHDFKGPLTTIVGFADVLADDDRFDPESRQYLGMISSSAMRLASLATDTLALSRLEHNELALSLGEVDLVALVRDVVRVFSVTRPIDLRVLGSTLVVTGDEARLRQVVENLVGNAIKYSPGGDPVEVSLRARQGGVELSVRDRGIGIPDGERGKLFGRFARASNARALGIGGTGFGLYLAKTIVDLHGGAIDVESVEGQGSTFRTFVPAKPAHRTAAPIRIALLDVDGDARSYVAQALRDDGFAVTVATNGEDLLRALGDGRYDVALVDADRLGMPADQFLRRANGCPLVRIALRMPASLDGWNAFLTKPFLMKDLYGAVDAAMDQSNGARPGASVTAPAP